MEGIEENFDEKVPMILKNAVLAQSSPLPENTPIIKGNKTID